MEGSHPPYPEDRTGPQFVAFFLNQKEAFSLTKFKLKLALDHFGKFFTLGAEGPSTPPCVKVAHFGHFAFFAKNGCL